jgi:hypothetical protein
VKPTYLLKKLRNQNRSTALLTNAQGTHQHCTPDTPSDPTLLYARTRTRAIGLGDELLRVLSGSLREGDEADLAVIFDLLPFYVDVVATADAAARLITTTAPAVRKEGEASIPQYFISTRFLTECYTFLTADTEGRERLHLVTGVQIDSNRYTLDQMQRVAMSEQSATGARAEQHAFTRALIDLTESGHALHAIFHSHPEYGPQATYPSAIDLRTHQLHEQGDYPLIGAIFAKGDQASTGYVRFFNATNSPFTVTIYGKGVTAVPGEKHVYQIETKPRRVSYETIAGN